MFSLQAFCSWLEAISSRGENVNLKQQHFLCWLKLHFGEKPCLHGNCKPMDQCTICKDVLKYFGAAFLSFYVSCFPGGETVWSSCSGKGKVYDHMPVEGEAAVPEDGWAGPVPLLRSGEAPLCFLACLVLLEPCLEFVYRDVFCLTKY